MSLRRTLPILVVAILVGLLAWLSARGVVQGPAGGARSTATSDTTAPAGAPPGEPAGRLHALPAGQRPDPGAVDGPAPPVPGEPEAPAQTLIVRVLDSNGSPAESATIAVHDVFVAAAGRLDDMVIATGATDGAGRAKFALRGVSSILVHAHRRGESAAVKASLFKQTEATAEIRLAPSSCIRGKVVYPDDVPVDGAGVTASFENRQGTLTLRATAGSDGRFVLQDVPADRLERRPLLRVLRGPGHWGVEESPSPEEARSGEVVLRVDRTTLVRGRCIDAAGGAVPDVHVTISTEKWNWSTTAGDDGRFEGEFPRGRGFIEFASDRTLETRIDPFVVEGASLDLGDFVLPHGVAIRGVALDRDGRPVPHAFVQATSSGKSRSARADAQGRFAVERLTPGQRYDIQVQAPPEREGHGVPEADAGEALGVDAPTEGTVVRLGGSRFVSIRVRWPDGRASSFGFTLKIRREDGGGPPDTTRHAGGPASDLVRFRVETPGVYDLTLAHALFEPIQFEDVRVEAGRETFLEAAPRKRP